MDVNPQKSELDMERGLGTSLMRTPQLLASHHRVTEHPEQAGTAGLTAPTPVPQRSTHTSSPAPGAQGPPARPALSLSQRPTLAADPLPNTRPCPVPAPHRSPGTRHGKSQRVYFSSLPESLPRALHRRQPPAPQSPSGPPPSSAAAPGPRRPSPARGPPQRRPLRACAAPPPPWRSRRPAARLRSAAACPPLMAGGVMAAPPEGRRREGAKGCGCRGTDGPRVCHGKG